MADRFAVATGNWSNDTTVWSATSGGAGGASHPTATDNAYFDAASGAITVTVDVSSACLDLGMRGSGGASSFTGTLTGSADLSIFGSCTLSGSMTQSFSGAVNFSATSIGKTITSNGKNISTGTVFITFNGVGGGWTLQDAFAGPTSTGITLTMSNGTLTTNDKAVTITSVSGAGGTIQMGASAWQSRTWAYTGTLSAGTSTITITNPGQINNALSFAGNGATFNNVIFTDAGNANAACAITGANSYANLTISNSGSSAASQYTISANQTISGTFTVTGNNTGNQRIQIISSVPGTARTITAAVVALTNCDFQDTTGAGAATWSGTSLGNALGNTNITFTTPVTLYKIGGTLNWFSAGTWSLSSGGASSGTVPLCHDTVNLDANSFSANSQTLTINGTNSNIESWLCATINYSAVNRTGITIAGSTTFAATLFASFTGNANVSQTVVRNYFSGRGSHFIASSGGSFTSSLLINSIGGQYSLTDALSLTGGTLQLDNGIFATSNFSVTCPGFSSANSNTRTMSLGSSTVTITGAGGWSTGSTTGFTFNAGTSTIDFTRVSGSAQPSFGGLTYNNIKCSLTGVADLFAINGNNTVIGGTMSFNSTTTSNKWYLNATGVTIANLDFTNFAGTWAGDGGVLALIITGNLTLSTGMSITNTGAISFTSTSTATITSNGKTLASAITFNGVAGTFSLAGNFATTNNITLTQGTLTTNNFNISCIAFTSGGALTRVINLGSSTFTCTGNNAGVSWGVTATGLTLNAGTSTLLFTGSGSDTALGAGLTYFNITLGGVTNLPTTLNGSSTVAGTLTVSNTFASTTVQIFSSSGGVPTYNNVVFSGFVGTWTNASPGAGTITGNLTLASGMSITYAQTLTFTSSSSATITSNGKSFISNLVFNGTGTWTLQDNLTTSLDSTLTQGTIALGANTFQCQTINVSNSNVRGFTGTGTVLLGGTTTAWNAGTATNLSIASTVTIKLNNSTNSAITFAGGGATYGTLYWNRGASTASNTISGSNTFASFKDDGTVAHSILFTTGTTQTIALWNVRGSGAGNEISINSTTTGTHALVKSGNDVVNADYLNIQHSVATPTLNTWYAGSNSINNQATATSGSGWIFSAPPSRGKGGGLNSLSDLSMLRMVRAY